MNYFILLWLKLLLAQIQISRGCGLSENLSTSICWGSGSGESPLPEVIDIDVDDTIEGPKVLKSYCFMNSPAYVRISPASNKYFQIRWERDVDRIIEVILTDEPLQNYYLETGSTEFSLDFIQTCSSAGPTLKFNTFIFNITISFKPPIFLKRSYNLEIPTNWERYVPINFKTDIIVSDSNVNSCDPTTRVLFESSDSRVLIENVKLCEAKHPDQSGVLVVPCLYDLRLYLTSDAQLHEDIQFHIIATLVSDQSLKDVAVVTLRLIQRDVAFTCQWKKCLAWDEFGREWEGQPEKITSQNCPRDEAGISTWECLPDGEFKGDAPDFSKCSTKWLDGIVGNWREDVLIYLRNNTHEAKYSDELEWNFYGHEIQLILEVIRDVLKNIEMVEPEVFRRYVDHSLRICWNILTNHDPWNHLEPGDRPKIATLLLKTMESSLFELSSRKLANPANGLSENNTSALELFQSDEYAAMTGILFGSWHALLETTEDEHVITFPENCESSSENSCIILTLPVGDRDLIYAAMHIQLGFPPDILPGNINRLGPNGYPLNEKVLNGPLMTFSIHESGDKTWESENSMTPAGNVTITFRHKVEASGSRNHNVRRKIHDGELTQAVYDSSVCVFWDEENFLWSTKGCKLVQTTRVTSLCYCDHFTYFALLMDMHKYNKKDTPLEILTIVLGGLSTICLIICTIVFTTDTSKEGRSPRMFIIKHLCISLLLANASMLILVDRNYLGLSHGVCTAVAIVTQYIFLTAFLWMGIEGLYLFRNVVLVFDVTADSWTLLKFRVGAFGLPVMIMGLTAIVGLVNDEHVFGGINYCWLEGNYIWSFLAPVAVVVVGNTVSTFLTVRAAYKSYKNLIPSQLNPQEFRFRLRGFFGLTITLGLSWILGFFLLIPDSTASTVTAYIFCILTGSQGIGIAVFYIFLNKKVRESLKRKMNWPNFTVSARKLAGNLDFRDKIPRAGGMKNGPRLGIASATFGIKRRNVRPIQSRVQVQHEDIRANENILEK